MHLGAFPDGLPGWEILLILPALDSAASKTRFLAFMKSPGTTFPLQKQTRFHEYHYHWRPSEGLCSIQVKEPLCMCMCEPFLIGIGGWGPIVFLNGA